MYLGWKWDDLSYQDLDSFLKVIVHLEAWYSHFFLCANIWLVDIILWVNFNWSYIYHILLFEKLLSYYHFFSSRELNSLLSAISIIGIYIPQIHHSILSLISVSYRVTNLKGWSWKFSLCWISPNFPWCIEWRSI